jgi:hypothetical protein
MRQPKIQRQPDGIVWTCGVCRTRERIVDHSLQGWREVSFAHEGMRVTGHVCGAHWPPDDASAEEQAQARDRVIEVLKQCTARPRQIT